MRQIATTIEQQIQRLKDRGMIFDCEDKSRKQIYYYLQVS